MKRRNQGKTRKLTQILGENQGRRLEKQGNQEALVWRSSERTKERGKADTRKVERKGRNQKEEGESRFGNLGRESRKALSDSGRKELNLEVSLFNPEKNGKEVRAKRKKRREKKRHQREERERNQETKVEDIKEWKEKVVRVGTGYRVRKDEKDQTRRRFDVGYSDRKVYKRKEGRDAVIDQGNMGRTLVGKGENARVKVMNAVCQREKRRQVSDYTGSGIRRKSRVGTRKLKPTKPQAKA